MICYPAKTHKRNLDRTMAGKTILIVEDENFARELFGYELWQEFEAKAVKHGFTKIVLKKPADKPLYMGVSVVKSSDTPSGAVQWRAKEGELVVYTNFAEKLARFYNGTNDDDLRAKTIRMLDGMLAVESARAKIVNKRLAPITLAGLDKIAYG